MRKLNSNYKAWQLACGLKNWLEQNNRKSATKFEFEMTPYYQAIGNDSRTKDKYWGIMNINGWIKPVEATSEWSVIENIKQLKPKSLGQMLIEDEITQRKLL